MLESFVSGDPSSNEVQRGCFNRAIATLITENESLGCLEIPPKYGRGTICLCDAELCNSATKTSTTTTTLTLATSLLLVVVVTIKTFFLWSASSLFTFKYFLVVWRSLNYNDGGNKRTTALTCVFCKNYDTYLTLQIKLFCWLLPLHSHDSFTNVFLNGPTRPLFVFIFGLFQTINSIFTTNKWENVHRCRD